MSKSAKANSPSSRRKTAGTMLARVQKVWGESPFYQARLSGPAPDRLTHTPKDSQAPDKAIGEALLDGVFAVGDDIIRCEKIEQAWRDARENTVLEAYLQEFGWLRHLSALGERGREPAQILCKAWFDRFEKWSVEAWAPRYVAERLLAMCAYNTLLLDGGDALWRSRVLTGMARQVRHLANTAHRADTAFERLMAALALTIAARCLPGCENAADRGMEMVRRELRLQLRADGGHVSRNPSLQLQLALRLHATLEAISTHGEQPPGFLRHTVMRVCTLAVFFRVGDGGLAIFNGGFEDEGAGLARISTSLEQNGAPTGFARHSGYHRLSAGKSILIVDASSDQTQAYRSAGSFHFSSGKSRLITNCGNGAQHAADWAHALRKRAAHSTFSFDDNESRMPSFADTAHRRAEDGQGSLIEFDCRLLIDAATDGIFSRRLFLAAGGADLRGEERVTALPFELQNVAVWRFHLHPSVKASLARDRRSVLIMTPQKEGWRFKSSAATIALEKSIYCGAGGVPVASEQIVVYAKSLSDFARRSDLTFKWALRRLDAV